MNIIINTFCNLHCPYCFADDAKDEYTKDIMPLENFSYCLDWLKRNEETLVQIIGGEPTINPQFTKYCDMVVERDYFKEIMIFTNGLFSDEICDYLVELSKKITVSFLINVNDPKWMGMEKYQQLKKNINKLYLKTIISIGINLYSPRQSYEYIVDLAEEFGIDHIRFSLTIPNISSDLEGFKQHYEENKENLLGLFKYAAKKHIQLYQDCNSIPICFMTKEDLAEFVKWYPMLFEKLTCDKAVTDVGPDLKVYKCFAFTNPEEAPNLYEFKDYYDIHHYFNQKYGELKRTPLTSSCQECGTFLLKGHSCGCWKYRKVNRC